MKTKLMTNIDSFLTSPKGYKKSWFRSFFGMFFVIVVAAVILALTFSFGPNSSAVGKFHENLSYSGVQNWLESSTLLSYVSLGILTLPFIILFSFWIIGINQTSKSRFFHLFMWLVVALSILLIMIALVLFIRCSITNYNIYA